jgi:signal peptidase I
MSERKAPARWTAIAAAVVIALLVAGAAAAMAGRPHTGLLRAPSASMAPALPLRSIFTVDYDAYQDTAPRLGDIIVFHPPAGVEQDKGCAEPPPKGSMCARAVARTSHALFVKRIVAGPGDRVAVRAGRVIRDGRRVAEPFAQRCDAQEGCNFPRPIVVPAGQYVVLGDNRGSSDDSRFWGPVRRAWIVGRVDRCGALGFHCHRR